MTAADAVRLIRGRRSRRWTPAWMQTIRFRLTVAYSAVLFGLAALVLGGVYLALRSNVEAAPLNPITVQKAYRDADGKWQVKPDHQFEAADIQSVEAAVNFRLLEKLEVYSFAAVGGLLLASLATGWWLSGRVLRPVRRITAAAQDISATDLSRRIELDGPRDELRTLADTVDDMLGRLEGAFTAQRQMMDDASHELRNPLASAGRSSPAFVDVAGDVDLATVAHEAAEEYAVLAADRGLRLTRRLAPGPMVARDPQALRRAVDNLLSNAVRLAPGDTELVLVVGSRSGWAWIALRDNGPGIAAADTERVFDRFFRPEGRPASRTRPPNRGPGWAWPSSGRSSRATPAR